MAKKTERKTDKQPISGVQWVERDKLNPNDYNPNHVAKAEIALLKISILENGWTQPIVCNADMTIVDGYHRWTVSADEKISGMTGGLVPVVVLAKTDKATQMISTIRHNRARGTHTVLKMGDIVVDLLSAGLSPKLIGERLQMEPDEVIRLSNSKGIPADVLVEGKAFSKSWIPK